MVDTTHRGHAADLAEMAVSDGADAVAVLGGDGTMSEVAGALVGTPCAVGPFQEDPRSVFARTIGLPRDTVAAAETLGEALRAGSIRTVGRVGGSATHRRDLDVFVLHAGVGWDAALVELVERRSTLKRHLGQLPFMAGAFAPSPAAMTAVEPHFSVHFDDGEVDTRTGSSASF